MAEASEASTISPLNILFEDLQEEMDGNDVLKMKRLLRGNQLSKEDMEKLQSASDVFHHLKERGDINDNKLGLLVQLFGQMGKELLKERVCKFKNEYNVTTDPVDNTLTSLSNGGNGLNHTSSTGMTGKINVVMHENERQRQELDLEERRVKLDLQKKLLELVQKYINSVPENDNAKLGECMDKLKEFGVDFTVAKHGSLLFILSFLTEANLDYFWQKYKDGSVDKALTSILIPTDIRDKALKAGITIRIKLEIDDKEYEEVKQKMQETVSFSTASRATSRRVTECDKWEAFVMEQVQDEQQAKKLLEQSKFDPVVDALRQEEFFFLNLVSFWFKSSFNFPPTVTKATEYAVTHVAKMYCKENNVQVENLSEILKVEFNDIGKCLYEHITEENVGILNPSWFNESISNLESYFFGLLTKSDDRYTFQSKYVYSYIIATYLSNIVAVSPNNIPMLLREEKTKILQANLSYCFPYVTGILGEKSSYYLNEVVKFSEMQTSIDIYNLGLVGSCLFESEIPSVFARNIEDVIGQNHTLDLSTCTAISNQSLHAVAVLLQYTSFIKEIKLYSESDEAFLSSEFKECLTNITADPLAIDRCTIRIKNYHDFAVTAKLLRVLPLLCKHAKSRSGSDTTQQPAVASLTISSNVSILVYTCAMEMFIKALSCMPHIEKLSLNGLGENLCELFLLCLSKETVSLNINMLCLAGNGLSWEHCRLLVDALNVLPCLTSLELSRNSIGSLGCTVLLPIKNEIAVSVDSNNIAHGLCEILSSCTPSEQLQNVDFITLSSLDDVASLMKSLLNVRHIDCTKLSNSQFSELCQNLPLLYNIVSIDLSGCELDQQIVLLLSERLKHLKDLQKVDLSHCCVSTDDMEVLLQNISPDITDLNLSNTKMPGFMLYILKLFKNLKHLNLSNNNFRSSDLIIWYIPMTVTHLNLSHNNLHEESFEGLKGLTELEELDVSYNKLTSFDTINILNAISTSVTTLNISHNNLEEMNAPFRDLTKLRKLDLSNNDFDECRRISLPCSTTHLNLSHNQIKAISESVNHLSLLTHLDMSHNHIIDIHLSVNCLSKLIHFDVSHNQIIGIGESVNLTQLTHLDMSHNKINQSLIDILKYLPTTSRYLDFSSNYIENVASVGNVISSFNDLKFINLGSNKFSDIGIQNMLNDVRSTDMDKINVSHNFTLMPHIIDQMPTVSINLEQDNLRLSDVESSSVYNNLAQVTEVNVSRLSEEECAGICKSLILLTNLTKLVMTENSLTNVQTFVTSLPHLHALTDLDLSKNQLHSATLDQIIRFLPSTLISLSLSHNMAKGDFSLKHLTKLQRLDLSHNNFKLPLHSLLLNASETLTYLDISFNKIENVDQFGKLISDFSDLYSINMNSNRIGAVGVQTLLSEIQNYDINCDIDVSHNLSGLQKIIPYIANQLSTSATGILPDFERENLTLKDEHLQVFFKTISKITTVEIPKNVELSETDYKSVLNNLSVFSNMERLIFVSLNPAIFPFLAESLKNFSCLRRLDISGSRIDNQGVKVVGNALLSLKRLEYINFSNTNIGMPDIKFLLDIHWQHTSKPFINVASNVHFVQAIFPSIKDQLSGSSIKGIDFDSDELHVISFTDIVQMTQLTNVSAKWKYWTDKDFEDFVQWLKYLNPELLDLSHNNIGDSGAKSLSEGMMSMYGLTHLDLSHNNIRDIGAKSLSEMMRSMPGLTHLDLSHNNIGYRGAMSLSEVMRSIDGLTHLDLSHNNIGDRGAMSLSEGMRSMHRLTHLDLSHNNVGDRGAMILSKVMRSMYGLTHLDLSHNNIGDSGAHRLSERVLSKPRLAHLDLSHNNTQYSGIKSYGEGISSLTSFEKSKAASEKEKATYKSAKSSMSYSQGEQHSKEMSYHRAQHKEQTLLPSFPQPSTSGYVPPTEKDPTKS